jgi:outer membrane protein
MTYLIQRALLAAALLASAQVQAQSAGQWTVRAGVGKLKPKVDSGDVSAPALPGTKAAVSADTQPVLNVGYGLTDNIAVELNLGLPYKHKISGAGAIEGTGVLGTVKALPPALMLQYRPFQPDAMLRPFVGVGASYAYFADETGSGRLTAISDIGGPPTTFSIKNKLTAVVQIGLTVNLGAHWYADACLSKGFLKTMVKFSSGQTQAMRLDPQAASIGLGYRF